MDNLKKRRGFACKLTKLLNDNFSEEAISFYTDAAGFQHKYNPQNEVRSIRTMAWQLKNEGLYPHCTAKRSHLGLGGRVAHFILEIAHQRGVGLCEQDEGKINGDMLSDFIKTHFQETFSWHRIPKGKRFFQVDVLYKAFKKQGKLWIQLEQSSLAHLLVHRTLILWKNIFNYFKSELRTHAFEKTIKIMKHSNNFI